MRYIDEVQLFLDSTVKCKPLFLSSQETHDDPKACVHRESAAPAESRVEIAPPAKASGCALGLCLALK